MPRFEDKLKEMRAQKEDASKDPNANTIENKTIKLFGDLHKQPPAPNLNSPVPEDYKEIVDNMAYAVMLLSKCIEDFATINQGATIASIDYLKAFEKSEVRDKIMDPIKHIAVTKLMFDI